MPAGIKKGRHSIALKTFLFRFCINSGLVAATACGTAAGAPAVTQINIRIEMESHPGKIDFYILGLSHKLFIYYEFVSLDIKCVI